jgi:glycosyltransferase involved in cell wall biosynthesis
MTANPELGGAGRFAYGRAEWALAGLGHAIICVSEEEREHARGLGIIEKKLFVVPNGIPYGKEPLSVVDRSRFGIAEDAIVIGFVGRLVPQKDPANLLRSFATIAAEFPQACLVMVGSGPLENTLKELALGLGIGNRVHWLGSQDGPASMRMFDIFALPSLYEGMPYVLLEALNAALPIVTTRTGGTGTLVEDFVNGYVLPILRPDLFGLALRELLADPPRRKSMSEQSRAKAASFTVEIMVDKIVEVYTGRSGL